MTGRFFTDQFSHIQFATQQLTKFQLANEKTIRKWENNELQQLRQLDGGVIQQEKKDVPSQTPSTNTFPTNLFSEPQRTKLIAEEAKGSKERISITYMALDFIQQY